MDDSKCVVAYEALRVTRNKTGITWQNTWMSDTEFLGKECRRVSVAVWGKESNRNLEMY